MSLTDSQKMIRETLCLAESALVERARLGLDAAAIYSQHLPRIGRMIAILDQRGLPSAVTGVGKGVAQVSNDM